LDALKKKKQNKRKRKEKTGKKTIVGDAEQDVLPRRKGTIQWLSRFFTGMREEEREGA